MEINKFLQSKSFQVVTWCVAIFILLFLVFSLGVFVGTQKASFSFRWADQYHKNFAGPAGGFFQKIEGREFMEANGVFGKIIQINEDSIIVEGKNNTEIIILVNDKTTIKSQTNNINISDLKVDDSVVIIGEPNDNGQIEAKLIRVILPMSVNNKRPPSQI